MNFFEQLPRIVKSFDAGNVRYALIGGLAMALRGVQRATLDADFILLSEDLDRCDDILQGMGYRREFQSENVTHYLAEDHALGRIDLLHAFRPATLSMLKRADRLTLTPGCEIPVVQTEDIIGLKVQASVNDPERKRGDWSDIFQLIGHSARSGMDLDWELVADYLDLFDLGNRLTELKQAYGKIASI